MPTITEQDILNALKVVQDPDLHKDIMSLGFVKKIKYCDDYVKFDVELTTPACSVRPFRAALIDPARDMALTG